MRFQAVQEVGDHGEKCPTCGGAVHRRPYGEVYAGAFVLDGERVEIRRVPHEQYADPIVLDALTQYFDGGLYRLWPSDRYFSRGGKKLHRDVWTMAFGPIPPGCHIHHKDGVHAHHALDNLECLPAGEHLSLSWREHGAHRSVHFTAHARDRAAEWHRSDEGRLWHRRNAERSKGWTKWKREDRACEQCGITFNALVRKSGNTQRFCTTVCKVNSYRARKLQNKWAADYRERQKAK